MAFFVACLGGQTAAEKPVGPGSREGERTAAEELAEAESRGSGVGGDQRNRESQETSSGHV